MSKLIESAGKWYADMLDEHQEVKVISKEADRETDTFDIKFQYDRLKFLLILDGDDEPFVRMILPNFYSIDTAEERRQMHNAVSRANQKCKGVKVFLNGDESDTTIVAEFLDPYLLGAKRDTYPEKGFPAELLHRYIDMIMSAASFYAGKMR